MNILALETATEACSVALLAAGGESFSEFEIAPRRHTELLPLMLDKVIQSAGIDRDQIDYVAFGNGPGAFTGVRIAASTAQGIAIGLGVPVVPVSTLAILAQHAVDTYSLNSVQAVLDARMGEVYGGLYQADDASGMVGLLEGAEFLVSAETILWPDAAIVGPGLRAGIDAGSSPDSGQFCDEKLLPHALALAKLARKAVDSGLTVAPQQVEINYLRNQVAWRN